MAGTIAVVQVSDAASKTVKVCVNKVSKAVFYRTSCLKTESPLMLANTGQQGLSAYELWLKAGNKGTEADFISSLKGQDGSSGSSTNVWASLDNCNKRVRLAENLYTDFSYKPERDKFEATTGCKVEDVNFSTYSGESRKRDNGLPFISEHKLLSIDTTQTGPGGRYFAVYKVKIENSDAVSGDVPITFCTAVSANNLPAYASYTAVTQISGDYYSLKVPLYFDSYGINASAPIYYTKNGYCFERVPYGLSSYRIKVGTLLGNLSVNEDPEKFVGLSIFDWWLSTRGWL